MNTSEKYLRKYTDDYASFAYREWDKHPATGEQLTGTYSEAGIEVEKAETFASITRLEISKHIWTKVLIMLENKKYNELLNEANLKLLAIDTLIENYESKL